MLRQVLFFSLLAALAFGDEDACTEKHPVIFFNGIMGSILKMNVDIPETQQVPDECLLKFNQTRIWIPSASFIATHLDCFPHYLLMNWDSKTQAWHNTEGVDIYVPDFGTTYSVTTLDPDMIFKHFSHYFYATIKKLEEVGFVDNDNIVSAAFDWRRAPTDEWVESTRKLIEATVEKHGSSIVPIVHSMGGPYVYYFIMKQTPEWRAKYIHKVMAVAPAWMGAPKSFYTFFNGLTGIPIFKDFMASLARRIPANWMLLPMGDAYEGVLLSTPSRNYTYAEIKDIMEALGTTDVSAKLAAAQKPFSPWGNAYNEPMDVPVMTLYARGVDTVMGMSCEEDLEHLMGDDEEWPSVDPVYGDGDGTVPTVSLLYYHNKWASDPSQNLELIEIPDTDHGKIVKNDVYFKLVIDTVCNS